ncbi:PKHD-type hydroxylase [Variibacter gotjawalensis]|uniref:PKHD-type hydroxylase n=1 Tax=Variibacter gotjawalensis TaxID=1333996 RepID=A0A0S3PZV5_9BRAD|nr:Fe2+-dependent dioxygenase [Variibacter gotjawalensis]NIK47265.1 PKHD-type hydroxylase [Variibacter gotjawalensis]RZS49165.1 PKHD-type hydroxylase [Variibacter gotjawalensis]BAT61427.1 PKHD-type hydroxylase [Variibacter gotjawalensis]
MLVHVPNVLTADEVARVRGILEASEWVDGRETAGEQAAMAKFNLQIPEGSQAGMEAGDIILRALGRNATFNSAALPLRVLPPLFNRYDAGMTFHAHVDGAIRAMPHNGQRIRADVSTTLFLTAPDEYDGGELIVEDTYGNHSVKLPVGDMIVYPSTSLHHVTPITRGSRWSSFFWTQSMIKDDGKRTLMYDLDQAIIDIRSKLDDREHSVVALTSHYHNLLRRWAEL